MRLPPSASPFNEEVGLLLQVDSGGEKGKSIECMNISSIFE